MLDYWSLEGVPLLPGATEDILKNAERRLKADIPEQLRLFYRYTEGNDVPGSPAADLVGERFMRAQDCIRDDTNPWLLVFCEFFMGGGFYAIDLGEGPGYGRGSVYLLTGKASIVATSFDEFTELFAREDPRLSPTGAKEYQRRLIGEKE